MTEARQTIAMIIRFRKSNKNSLGRQASGYRSSRFKMPYILCQGSLIFSEVKHIFISRYLIFGMNA
jgi:hypothetical protein